METGSLEETLTEINELRAERNALIHGVWATTTEPGTALVQTVRLQRRQVVQGELVTTAFSVCISFPIQNPSRYSIAPATRREYELFARMI